MTQAVSICLDWWTPIGLGIAMLGLAGTFWCFFRWLFVERVLPADLLLRRFHQPTRWLLLHRRPRKLLPYSLLLVGLGVLGLKARAIPGLVPWAFENPEICLMFQLAILAGIFWAILGWDPKPHFVVVEKGKANAQFRDIPEEWGPRAWNEGRRGGDGKPVAELLGYRSQSALARRWLNPGQQSRGNLTLISLRWEVLSRHILVFGATGSGKTSAFYAHIMATASSPWIYQDGKADLPYREMFPTRPVWGLDIRGHVSRSAIWNPIQEIRSTEDFDLLVDFIFPVQAHDANPWVREMARVLFGAILRARAWTSIQEIAREIRRTRIQPFLSVLPPVWADLLSEPRSQVPILQDLVATLARWETSRVSAVTEGQSTVSLDDFLTRGGFVMNCETGDALKAPVHLFWAMLFSRLRNRSEGSSPILLLLDEFGDCGRLPHIDRMLVLLRSKGVSLVAAIQNQGLLQEVYPRNWQAVLEGFGSRIWLAKNLDDVQRERLTKAIGRYTRKIPATYKKGQATDKETDLMPLDAWVSWSEEGAALGRIHGWSYWLPIPIPVPRTPLGEPMPVTDPWEREWRTIPPTATPGIEGIAKLPLSNHLPRSPKLSLPPTIEPSASQGVTPESEEDWP